MPLEVAQCDGLTDKANLRCDLWIAPARVRGDCIWCIPAKRAINLPAISQRENAIIMPDHKWKDRRLGQLFIVPAAVCGPLLRRYPDYFNVNLHFERRFRALHYL